MSPPEDALEGSGSLRGIESDPTGAPPSSDEKCTVCKDERRAARKYRWKIVVGLVFPFALQALDVTIIASALPWIADDFDRFVQLNWIISAFNLTSAAFILFWGQMADIFGRHATIQTCVVIVMVGSALCTAGPVNVFPVLLLGRGIQGLGCAGINVIVRIIIADKVSLKENAKNWSIFSFTAGMSYALGPVVGGYLTTSNWRWCFGINLPICVVSMALIFFVLRKELLGPTRIPWLDAGDADNDREAAEQQGTPSRAASAVRTGRMATFSARLTTIDVGGQLLFLFGFGLLILGLTWAGATYDWNTVAVLTPLCMGIVLAAGFISWERLMVPGRVLARRWPHKRPMLHWGMIVHKDICLLSYINLATGAAMYAVLYFVSLYFVMIKFYHASNAGVQLLYYTPGLGAGVYLSMVLCNKYPRKTFAPIMLGSVVEATGVAILAWALYHEDLATIYGMMALTGAGTGLRFMPGPLHALGYFHDRIASVMSLLAVMLPFGGTLALTIMTTVFNNVSGIERDSPYRKIGVFEAMNPESRKPILDRAKMGFVWAFVAIVPFMVLCMVAAAFLGNVDITSAQKSEGGGSGLDEQVIPHSVYDGIYLLHLLRRWRGRRIAISPDEAVEDAEKSKAKTMTVQGGDENNPSEDVSHLQRGERLNPAE